VIAQQGHPYISAMLKARKLALVFHPIDVARSVWTFGVTLSIDFIVYADIIITVYLTSETEPIVLLPISLSFSFQSQSRRISRENGIFTSRRRFMIPSFHQENHYASDSAAFYIVANHQDYAQALDIINTYPSNKHSIKMSTDSGSQTLGGR
jgi:hypothetical protein